MWVFDATPLNCLAKVNGSHLSNFETSTAIDATSPS